MTTTAQIDAFLACKRIGFAGVSRNPSELSRTIFRELVARGYDVVPIHPTAKSIEGRPAFASVLDARPLDAVFVMTPPAATEEIVHECKQAGIRRVWMHRGAGQGSVDWHAAHYARAFGIDVIEGECPMMFLPGTARIHRAHAAIRRATGHYPDAAPAARMPHGAWRALGHGAIAWALATWAMLAIGGMFTWHAGLAARLVVIPASFGLLAWLHAGPGRPSPLATAAWFAVAALALDALILCGLVERSPALLASTTQTWIPYVLGFAAAVGAATHRQRPFVRALRPAAV